MKARKPKIPFVLNLVPTGLLPTKGDNPRLPVTPEEIASDVVECAAVGISMVHVHARDPYGSPTLDKSVYAEIIGRIRRECPLVVICVSLSGRGGRQLDQRMEPMFLDGDLKPDMASLTLSSLNFNREASVNDPSTVRALAEAMLDREIKPEIEVFDLGMANCMNYLADRGVLKPPFYANLILGNISCAQADMMHMGLLVSELPDGTLWSAGGVGGWQLTANAAALAFGGGVRVGLEDNLWFDEERTILATNLKLVNRIHDLAGCHRIRNMSPSQLREVLGLNAGGSDGYGVKKI